MELVGCGPRSGCVGCPPPAEEQRLYFFSCEEVQSAGGSGQQQPILSAIADAAGSVGGPGVGMVDGLFPDQWKRVGSDWELTAEDRRMLVLYEAWLPQRVFDAHAHLWNLEYWSKDVASFNSDAWPESRPTGLPDSAGDMEHFRRQMQRFIPERELGGLVLTTPNLACDDVGHSAWSAEECRRASPVVFVCAMTTTMVTTYADIVHGVETYGYVGLKPYHFYAKNVADTNQADIMDFVSEEQCRAAHDLELTISLHMVKARALSDESNLTTVRRLCESFPKMKLILCHSARGFNMHHVIDSIESLRGLPNLYFDTGAVTEAGATNALLRVFGPSRVMYGSDWPVAETRGKCITIGDSFIWVTPANIDLISRAAGSKGIVAPALVGFETLQALKQACDEVGLSRAEVEMVFWGTAESLWGETWRQQHEAEGGSAPLPVPAPCLSRAEDYVRRANNGVTQLVQHTAGTKPSL